MCLCHGIGSRNFFFFGWACVCVRAMERISNELLLIERRNLSSISRGYVLKFSVCSI